MDRSPYHPVREGEIMPKALDEALGDGAKRTALAAEPPSNPHKDIRFSTSWDGILGREVPDDALSEAAKLERTLERLAEGEGISAPEREALFREWRDDASQRPLHEKGVDYSDRPYGGDPEPGRLAGI